jgi:hypothetical protein
MLVSIVPVSTSAICFAERRNGQDGYVLACRIAGHRYRFTADGATMRWHCARGCGARGEKRYGRADEAARYARAFDREDREDLGRRAPLVGLLPLRLWWLFRRLRRVA